MLHTPSRYLLLDNASPIPRIAASKYVRLGAINALILTAGGLDQKMHQKDIFGEAGVRREQHSAGFERVIRDLCGGKSADRRASICSGDPTTLFCWSATRPIRTIPSRNGHYSRSATIVNRSSPHRPKFRRLFDTNLRRLRPFGDVVEILRVEGSERGGRNMRRLFSRSVQFSVCVALLVFGGVQFARAEVASIYGGSDGLCGSRTANGERLDCSAMTAAHRTLPFGTLVKVCHSGCVVVRINDRGPFVRGRHIDLSPAAARAIGLHQTGQVAMSLEETTSYRASALPIAQRAIGLHHIGQVAMSADETTGYQTSTPPTAPRAIALHRTRQVAMSAEDTTRRQVSLPSDLFAKDSIANRLIGNDPITK
jgi:rare lipoprotein A (peptidoglycan hydrolase)